jgi:hypothetical protein
MFTETTMEKRKNLKKNSIILKNSTILEKPIVSQNLKVLSCDFEIGHIFRIISII